MEGNKNKQTTKGKISGSLLFGLKLISIERVRKSVSLKIQPLSELSYATEHRKILCLSQCILDTVELEKENMHLKRHSILGRIEIQTNRSVQQVEQIKRLKQQNNDLKIQLQEAQQWNVYSSMAAAIAFASCCYTFQEHDKIN